MNKAILVGRLTKDPELKFIAGSGTAVCTFTMAVNRRFKKEGQPEADFLSIVVWGKQAEATASHTAKGKLISVSGSITTRNYENKEGKKVYVTEINADEVQFLEWAKKDEITESGSEYGFNSGLNGGYDFGSNEELTPLDGDIPF